MDVKPRQVWLGVGLGVVLGGLIAAFAAGLLAELAILLATIAACAAALIPLFVERNPRPAPTDGPRAVRARSGAALLRRRRQAGAADSGTVPPTPISLPSGSRKVTLRTELS